MSSAYEKARLRNIARNNAELRRLGLTERLPAPKRKARRPAAKGTRKEKARKVAGASGPLRRSTRHTGKARVSYADAEESAEEVDEWIDSATPPPPKRLKTIKSAVIKKTLASSAAKGIAHKSTLLTIENAKTGRSSCRLCRENIPKNAPRVGMLSWIVGRNAMTWQHPSCFLSRLCVSTATTNKTVCKASKLPIPKGQVKLGCRSHSSTAWVSLEAFPALILPVLRAANDASTAIDPANKANTKVPRDIEGMEKLKDEQRVSLMSVLDRTDSELAESLSRDTVGATVSQSKTPKKKTPKKKGLGDTSDQPKAGTKSNAKGPVTWKFGAYLCHGTLLPSRETKTHCYARTHKGNIKTLKKGGTYWRLGD